MLLQISPYVCLLSLFFLLLLFLGLSLLVLSVLLRSSCIPPRLFVLARRHCLLVFLFPFLSLSLSLVCSSYFFSLKSTSSFDILPHRYKSLSCSLMLLSSSHNELYFSVSFSVWLFLLYTRVCLSHSHTHTFSVCPSVIVCLSHLLRLAPCLSWSKHSCSRFVRPMIAATHLSHGRSCQPSVDNRPLQPRSAPVTRLVCVPPRTCYSVTERTRRQTVPTCVDLCRLPDTLFICFSSCVLPFQLFPKDLLRTIDLMPPSLFPPLCSHKWHHAPVLGKSHADGIWQGHRWPRRAHGLSHAGQGMLRYR